MLIILLILSFSNTIDNKAKEPLSESFNRALITFGIVRSIDAVISVVQGTEVAIEPGGVGVVLTPGEIFDPINDLIERFSWVVLAASTSLGAQRILVEIGTTFIAQIVVLLATSLLLIMLWKPRLLPGFFRPFIFRVSMTILLLRFLIPTVVLASELVYETFLSDQYQSHYDSLEQTDRDVRALQSEEDADISVEAEGGFLGSIGRWYDRTTQVISLSARFLAYASRLEGASEYIVNLIVVFILQTLVFPLLFFWLAIRFGGLIINGKFWLFLKNGYQIKEG